MAPDARHCARGSCPWGTANEGSPGYQQPGYQHFATCQLAVQLLYQGCAESSAPLHPVSTWVALGVPLPGHLLMQPASLFPDEVTHNLFHCHP